MPLGWIVTQPPTSGFLEGQSKKISGQLQGGQPHEGPLVSQLKKISGGLVGSTPHSGPIASQTKRITGQLNGLQSQVGTIGGSLSKLTGRIDQAAVTGQLTGSLKKVISSLSASQTVSGQISGQLKKDVFQGSGVQVYSGTLQSQLKKAVAALLGSQLQSGTIAGQLKKEVADLVGEATIPFDPFTETYTAPGSYDFVTPPGAGYKIDRIAVGGGRAGRAYGFGVGSNGGRAGKFGYDTLVEGVHFTAGQIITVTVGTGGASNGAHGTPSTILVNGNTLEGAIATETSYLSGYTGEPVNTGNTNSNKDLLLNGVTYEGGSGGTGTSSNDSAGPPVYPGGGGWGSNSNGVNGRPGGHGKVWLRFYL